jgi:hypothetical protein
MSHPRWKIEKVRREEIAEKLNIIEMEKTNA